MKEHLQAIPLQIKNADKFFQELSENIDALQSFERPHPLSIPIAITKVKKFVAEERYRIQLHDLIQDEMNRLCEGLVSISYQDENHTINQSDYKNEFQKRILEYEQITSMAIGIFSTSTYFDNGDTSKIISDNIERMVRNAQEEGSSFNLQTVPSTTCLLFYWNRLNTCKQLQITCSTPDKFCKK